MRSISPTAPGPKPSLRERAWFLGLTLAAALGGLFLALRWGEGRMMSGGGAFPFGSVLLLAAGWAPALAAAVWAAWRPARALAILLFVSAAASDWFEQAASPWGGFAKAFYYDLILAAALIGVAFRAAAEWRDWRWPRTPVTLPLLAYAAAGLVFVARGLPAAERINDALGDFRRAFFYPLVFFLALWEARRNPRALFWMAGAFVCGALVQILEGFTGIFTRRFHQLFFADVFHILSHYSTTMLSVVFYLGLSALFLRRRRSERMWAAVAVAAVPVLILIANFRAAWAGLAVGTALTLARCGVRLPQLRRIAPTALAALVAAAILVLVLGGIQIAPGVSLRGEVLTKFERLAHFQSDPNVQWRFASYRAALEGWAAHPVLGVGLGVFPIFHVAGTFGGQYLAFGHRIHNSYLWFLYATGAAGFGLFLWVQITLFRSLWRAAGGAPAPLTRLWATAFLGFTAHFLTATFFHHLFESSVPALVLYTLAGATLGALSGNRGTEGLP